MTDIRSIEANEDPVCGMKIDPDAASAKGLTLDFEGRAYVFCGKGCFLEFTDDPARYLDPRYVPAM